MIGSQIRACFCSFLRHLRMESLIKIFDISLEHCITTYLGVTGRWKCLVHHRCYVIMPINNYWSNELRSSWGKVVDRFWYRLRIGILTFSINILRTFQGWINIQPKSRLRLECLTTKINGSRRALIRGRYGCADKWWSSGSLIFLHEHTLNSDRYGVIKRIWQFIHHSLRVILLTIEGLSFKLILVDCFWSSIKMPWGY